MPQGGGSVYSPPTSRESWGGNGVTIAAGGGDWLTWNSSGGPDTVLHNTTPAHPTVIAAGVYLVSVVVSTGGLIQGAAAGYYDAGLFLDRTGFNASMTAKSSMVSSVGQYASDVALSFAWYIPAGGQIGVFVDSFNGGATAADFSLAFANVQRLA